MRCQNLYNRGVIWLLRSPLHGLICDLITFTSALPTPSEHEVAGVGTGNRRRSVGGLDFGHVAGHPHERGLRDRRRRPAEPSTAVVYGLAALMGLVAGAILGTPQWLVLRRHVRRAAWWIPANALAWVPGMVMAFYAAAFIFSTSIGGSTVVLAVGTLAAIGAVVGAIHGLALVWLVRLRD